MKKAAAILLGMALLTGCANNNEEPADTDPVDVEQDSSNEVIQSEDTNSELEENVDEEVVEEETPAVSENNDALTDFPEHDVIAEHIDLAVYKSEIETDNEGTRVILFENAEGHKEYKSVFVKHDNRLKIIKLDDDGLLYNDKIN